MKTLNVKDKTATRLTRVIGWLQHTYGKKFTVDDAVNKVMTDWLHFSEISENCNGELKTLVPISMTKEEKK